jgi:hypothetical protein
MNQIDPTREEVNFWDHIKPDRDQIDPTREEDHPHLGGRVEPEQSRSI